MAYIEIFPKSTETQQRLADHSAPMMDILYQATKRILNVPDHDIIIELNQCTAIEFNSLAVQSSAVPDVVIKISTSDHDLQQKFQSLCDLIVRKWSAQFGNTLKLEIWINLIDTWGCNIDLN
ncbi:hypothetical protein LB559_06540 [Mesorhizobium sp. BR1-1-3]|jgi:hypothetical protein|uniref:hypothetical protein n=1 Tax=unclassified Mesorhizobium TaxID=325217 RepID=UPI000F74E2B7|nr:MULTISPECIES: hypothetical protein [unclassified Mesorhizobium]RWE29329.1 MAG: hypothetical protein EOS78_30265 [Mesorhizobium sp.]AZO45269.1 hypothetical protein EJ076_31300 [Mesorhizobium sp. M7D.F.Ca.US.005.01.1.1]MBZ9887597.1 hypothetical protein [Mesorhizobium sp. BR1-1-3]TGP88027.1 hypothetical protein EN861_28930 [Mesorhizobium sp. M8A.F.Ca.ET.218.01.1.1]TGT15825.1 hypothetical protein EN856_28745 [Mesorhizobium sp. M8A.F.Ca.ET.213.01.1.1]